MRIVHQPARLRGTSHFDRRHTPEPIAGSNSTPLLECIALENLVKRSRFTFAEIVGMVAISPGELQALKATLGEATAATCFSYRQAILELLKRRNGGKMAEQKPVLDPLTRLAKSILSTQALSTNTDREQAKLFLASAEYLRKRLEARRGN